MTKANKQDTPEERNEKEEVLDAEALREEAEKPEEIDKADETLSPEEEVRKLEDQLLRTLAEMDNLRKRTAREMEETRKYAIDSFAQDLFGVMDNLYRAEESVPQEQLEENPLLKNIYEGVLMTRKELARTFKKYGIERVEPLHEAFDHNLHQAMVEIPTDEHKPGTIVQVMQAGYTLHNRLVRPAMVGIAKALPEG